MLAARDQENLVHAHQTTAAGKPLNLGIRGLQPKTPGNNLKTPFRPAKNDENKAFTLKGTKLGGDGKFDKNAFVTPIGPRTRAPLGQKTTNARAQTFKTPGPQQQDLKTLKLDGKPSTARKSIKSKITIAPSEPVETDALTVDDDDLPEPEYAPPPPVELPDPPMEFPYNQKFPQLQGMNLMRGYGEVYGSPTDEHGISLRIKQEQKAKEQYDQDMDQKILKSLESWRSLEEQDAECEAQVEAMIAAGPKSKRKVVSGVDTFRARTAAGALSHSNAGVPAVATKSTASSMQKSRKPAFSVLGAKKQPEPTNPSHMRHTAAAAVSKNTIGYPKAKKPASIIPASERPATHASKNMGNTKVNQARIHPKDFLKLYGEPPVESDMWFRLREYELIEERRKEEDGDYVIDDLFGTQVLPGGEEDEGEEELFQLPMP